MCTYARRVPQLVLGLLGAGFVGGLITRWVDTRAERRRSRRERSSNAFARFLAAATEVYLNRSLPSGLRSADDLRVGDDDRRELTAALAEIELHASPDVAAAANAVFVLVTNPPDRFPTGAELAAAWRPLVVLCRRDLGT